MGIKSSGIDQELIRFAATGVLTNLDTLIVPGVSEFNQTDVLAVDLLIHSLGLVRAGIFSSPFLTPMIGPGIGCITTAMELFGSVERGVWVVQIRSQPLNKVRLANQISQFAKQFATVVVLGSASGHLQVGPPDIALVRNMAAVHMGGMTKHLPATHTVVATGSDDAQGLAQKCLEIIQ